MNQDGIIIDFERGLSLSEAREQTVIKLGISVKGLADVMKELTEMIARGEILAEPKDTDYGKVFKVVPPSLDFEEMSRVIDQVIRYNQCMITPSDHAYMYLSASDIASQMRDVEVYQEPVSPSELKGRYKKDLRSMLERGRIY